jgi:hypothetical protein
MKTAGQTTAKAASPAAQDNTAPEVLQDILPSMPVVAAMSQPQDIIHIDVPTPSSSFKFSSPVWNPKAGLTQRLADSISSIFSVESITSFTNAYQQYSEQSLTMPQYPSDLESQL